MNNEHMLFGILFFMAIYTFLFSDFVRKQKSRNMEKLPTVIEIKSLVLSQRLPHHERGTGKPSRFKITMNFAKMNFHSWYLYLFNQIINGNSGPLWGLISLCAILCLRTWLFIHSILTRCVIVNKRRWKLSDPIDINTVVRPDYFFCKHLRLTVNKKDQRTMKIPIKIFLAFPLF